ncbi:MAG: hypothetical protein HYT15_01820 [Candidatus Magasanikbacteria bacterium]|nr:hypothetical protein [Candidatus Magasanikbacteria bacterium]
MELSEKMQQWHSVESQLKLADIILVHGETPIRRAIQKRTGSYWNHVALVLQPPQLSLGMRGAFIIGAINKGIEVHRLRKYSEERGKFDIGVKRLPWLTDEMRENILLFMLNKIDSPYDYTRLFGYIFEGMLKFILPKEAFKKVRRSIVVSEPNSFVCSTFIQHAFLESVPRKMQAKTFARDHLRSLLEIEEMTPADFAHSQNYEWIFNPHV